jgi:succinyl-CoA synthetase beta subunit
MARFTGRQGCLNEVASKAALAAFGLPVPEGRSVSPGQAGKAAQEVGFPVALKVLAPFLAHKTEAGAVALGLQSPAEVRTALAGMKASFSSRGVGSIDTVLVESMVNDAVAELIVGVVRDQSLGLGLLVGSGGVLVELVKDTQHLLLPTSREAIEKALSRLAVSKLLVGLPRARSRRHRSGGERHYLGGGVRAGPPRTAVGAGHKPSAGAAAGAWCRGGGRVDPSGGP